MADENNPNETERPQAESGNTERKPFDTSDVSWVPDLQDDDPPYRDWWVVDEERHDE